MPISEVHIMAKIQGKASKRKSPDPQKKIDSQVTTTGCAKLETQSMGRLRMLIVLAWQDLITVMKNTYFVFPIPSLLQREVFVVDTLCSLHSPSFCIGNSRD